MTDINAYRNCNTEDTAPVSAAQFFVAFAMDQEHPIGRKEAEMRGCRTTAEIITQTISGLTESDLNLPVAWVQQIQKIAEFFGTIVPKNEFESSVVQHTLDSLRIGTVSPRSAAFVAWCGKIWRDRLATQAAEEEVATATVPTGTVTIAAVFNGVQTKTTSYGVFHVHSFTAEDGKELEWWTDTNWGYNPATNADAPKDGDKVSLRCRFKKPSVWRGKVTYRVTHCKFNKA